MGTIPGQMGSWFCRDNARLGPANVARIFVVRGDPRGDGPRILASTEYVGVESYELNKAVLDRIFASIDFED